MRKLTNQEIHLACGGVTSHGYNFTYVINNTLTGLFLGWVFPGIAPALGLTTFIVNPALATGALFGAYALAGVGANILDQTLFSYDSIAVQTTTLTANPA